MKNYFYSLKDTHKEPGKCKSQLQNSTKRHKQPPETGRKTSGFNYNHKVHLVNHNILTLASCECVNATPAVGISLDCEH